MKRVLKLTDSGSATSVPTVDPIIAQLHQRLMRNDYADSLEVRLALLADMVYRIHLNTTNVHQR